MDKRIHKALIFIILITGFLLTSSNDVTIAQESGYPNKPINFFIPYGGGAGIPHRALNDAASKYLGQPIISIDKPGGAGVPAAMAIAAAKPDGYTIGGATMSMCMIAPYDPETPYKNLDKFRFISNIGVFIHAYIVKSDAPWKTWKELIDWAKQNPGGVKIGITGAKWNNYSGLILSQVEMKEKLKFSYVPFKAGAEIITAVLGDHITMYASALGADAMSFVKAGKARVLATANMKVPEFGDIPTLIDFHALKSFPITVKAIMGPKGLPDSVVLKLDDAFSKAMKEPSFINVMKQYNIAVLYMNQREISEYMEKGFKETGEVIRILRDEAKEKK